MTTGAMRQKSGERIRVAMIGCGAVAQHHARHLASCEVTRLVAVVDSDRVAAEAFAGRWGVQRVHTSIAEMVEAGEVDAVHITTPPGSHEPLVREAIESGLDVLVEKPIAYSRAATAELYELASARGVRLVPDFSLFFTEQMCRARQWLAEGRIGRLVCVQCAYQTRLDRGRLEEPQSPPWLFNLPAGPLHNFITHPLYLVLQFTGPVCGVHVIPRHVGYLPQGLTDNLDLLIQGADCSALVNVSLAAQPTQITLVIQGEKGRILVDFEAFQVTLETAPGRLSSVMRLLRPSLRGLSAFRQTARVGWQVARKRLVPYAGLKALIERFYSVPRTESPIPQSLVLQVAQAEEEVVKAPGVWSLPFVGACQTVPAAARANWVAVTGGTGRLGAHVVNELRRRGYSVRLLVRWQSRAMPPAGQDLEVVYGDARNPEDMRRLLAGTEGLVHMAAGMSGSRQFVLDSSVEATRNVLRSARELGLNRSIYISSMAVFDYQVLGRNGALHDTSPLEAAPEERSSYAQAKTRAEQLVQEEMAQGGQWMILRPSQIFGTGDIAAQIGSRVGRHFLVLGGPRKRMRLVQVQDTARAIVEFLAPHRFRPGVTLNITHPDVLQAREVAGLLRRCGGARVIYLRPWLGKSLAWATRLAHTLLKGGPRISSRQAAYLFCECAANPTLALELGWKPAAPLSVQVESALQPPEGARKG